MQFQEKSVLTTGTGQNLRSELCCTRGANRTLWLTVTKEVYCWELEADPRGRILVLIARLESDCVIL